MRSCNAASRPGLPRCWGFRRPRFESYNAQLDAGCAAAIGVPKEGLSHGIECLWRCNPIHIDSDHSIAPRILMNKSLLLASLVAAAALAACGKTEQPAAPATAPAAAAVKDVAASAAAPAAAAATPAASAVPGAADTAASAAAGAAATAAAAATDAAAKAAQSAASEAKK
jgi:hypothetical protein